MVPTKKVEKTPYELWHGNVPNLSYLKNSLISQEASGSYEDLEEIQDEDTHPSESTSEHHEEVEHEIVKPQSDVILVCRLEMTHRAPKRLCLYVDVEEHELGDHDIEAIKILIAITMFYDYEIWQMDVKTTFLNDNLTEEVYMVQPESSRLSGGQMRRTRNSVRHTLAKSVENSLMLLGCAAHSWKCAAYLNSKCGSISMQEKLFLSKSQGPLTPEESAKQSTTAMSSTEAKYISASEATMEVIWIRKFIDGLRVTPNNNEPMEMYCDNYDVVIIDNEPGVQRGAKHYRRKVHCIREVIEEGDLNLLKVHIDDNIVDPLTKALPCTKNVNHLMSIGLCPASSLM
ncbi:retrotransposon protein, putative, ty1-copia subclass [Tanacetum coccineum]